MLQGQDGSPPYTKAARIAPGGFCILAGEILDANGAFKNFYGGAADARHQFFVGLRDFHFDLACRV